MEAVWSFVTAFVEAVNVAAVEPADTGMVEGTFTAALLLESVRIRPPAGAAVVSVAVQFAVPPLSTVVGEQEIPAISACAVTISEVAREEPL
jgi:hypothetical protein